jgi:hypothetical protein
LYYGDTTRVINLRRYDDITAEWKQMAVPPLWGLDIVESVSGAETGSVLTGHPDSLYLETYQWWSYNSVSDTWSHDQAIPSSQVEPPNASYAVTGSLFYYLSSGQIWESSLVDGSKRSVCDVPMAEGIYPILVADGNWLYLCSSNSNSLTFWKHPIQ